MWRKLFTPLRRGYHLVNAIANPALKASFVLFNTAHLLDMEHNPDKSAIHFDNPFPVQNTDIEDYNCEFKMIGEKNQEAMRNLIRTLNSAIEEICEQYQHCVVKQIEITLTCMSLDPVGPHWDELTKYRVEADDLKKEFVKYSMLAERIGVIIDGCGYTMESKDAMDEAIATDYKQLQSLIQQKVEENKYWDSKLLDVNTKSILFGSQPTESTSS